MDFLPGGSVVSLKSSPQLMMIFGFYQQVPEQAHWFDYIACPYPEGYLNSDSLMLFDHGQIDKLHFIGFIDDECLEFSKKITTEIGDRQNDE